MPLRDRGTRGGYLDPVIIADIDDGVVIPIEGDTISGDVPVIPGDGAVFTVQPNDSGFIDAFARQRFSEPFTLFDSKQIWDDPDIANSAENFPLFWDNQEVSGSGTSTLFNVNRASTTLAVSATTAGKRVRQTKQRFNYQPGKSQVAIFTNVDMQTSSGITKEVGLFDDNNGLFFRSSGGVRSVVVRSFATGAAVDRRVVNQADWSLDKMNGNGPSGVNLDFLLSQIPIIDFEWLGVGRVRYGWYVDGLPIYCHEELNANNLDVVYMSNPNLPVRYSIENDGTGAADSFETICTTVISEGGLQPNGAQRADDTGITPIGTPAAGTTYGIGGIRLKTAYISADIRETFISMIETSGANNPFIWRVHLNATVDVPGNFVYNDVSRSSIQFAGGSATATDNVIQAANAGFVLHCGMASRSTGEIAVPLESALRLGALIDGTRDEIIISNTPFTPNQNASLAINWREAW
jgi:hypothetical protein